MSEFTKTDNNQFKIYVFFLLLIYFHHSAGNEIFFTMPTLQQDIKHKKISLISTDIELTKINSNSLRNTNAQWTLKAENNIRHSLNQLLVNQGNEFLIYKIPSRESNADLIELISLQGLVNQSILSYFQVQLPSKNNFDWSIGPDAKLLKNSSGADYGLFLSFRAGFNAAADTLNYQVGMFSLVDLTSGQTVWFTLQSNRQSDIRDREKAFLVIRDMLKTFPNANL